MSECPATDSPDFAHNVLQAVTAVQSSWISGRTAGEVFEELLVHVLDITGSEYGYIGEVMTADDGAPYLLAHAITDISWDAASKALVDQARHGGGFAFRNLDTLYGEVLRTGQAVIANDAPNDPRAGGTAPGHLPLDRFLGLPLSSEDELVGSVGVSNRPGGYDQALVDALEPLLRSCGTMVRAFRERRKLEEANRRLAELAGTLRESLLPPAMPSIGWLDVAAKFKAADDGEGVLGDFYDVFQTVPGRWFFVLGDVRGHGPAAAKTTALARWTLQAQATQTKDPAELLNALNIQLNGRQDDDAPHLSAIAVIADLEANESLSPLTLSLCTAGHPPPIIRRADGSVKRLDPHGTILGVLDDVGLQTRHVELHAGDALILFTDGVTEGRTKDLLHGELDLAEALGASTATSASELVDVAMSMQSTSGATDDAAVVVLRVPT